MTNPIACSRRTSLLIVLHALLNAGCSGARGEPSGEPARFAVGTAAYEWTDESRRELHTAALDDERRVPVRAWYPAQANTSEHAPYFLNPLAHPFATGSRILADDSLAPELPETEDARDPSIALWSQDQRFVLSRLEQLDSEPGDRLSGHLDLARVGVFGHSRGGAAAALTCRDDPRFSACADLDGSVSADVMTSSLEQPFLLMRSGLDEATLDTFFAHLRGPSHRVEVTGAGHNSFSDLPRIVRDLQLPLDPEALLLGDLDPDRAFEINATYLEGFFANALCGAHDTVLAQRPPFDEVNVTRGGSLAAPD